MARLKVRVYLVNCSCSRGGLYVALIVLYAATSGIAGYSSASYYKQMEGVNWVSRQRLGCRDETQARLHVNIRRNR